MKRTILLLIGTAFLSTALGAQTPLETPQAFRNAVDMRTTLQDLSNAVDSMARLEELAGRVLILDGMVNSITIYSEDPNDFYIEMEIVSGRWDGVESVNIYKAYVYFDDPSFAGRMAERAPRQPDPSLTLRNDHVMVAGRLVTLAEDPEGLPVPVIQAYEIRPLR